MQKTELIVFKYKEEKTLEFLDTYLAPSSFGLFFGLEFSGDPSNLLPIGTLIYIDKEDKSINPWADGYATVIGYSASTIYPTPPAITVFTDRPLQLPITYTSGENGIIRYTNANSEYEVYEKLDIFDNEAFPLNFSIADIRNPDKRNSSFSKTIILPGTKRNNIFFNNIFDIGSDGTFDPRKKIQAVVYTDGLEQLNGVLQLTQIIRDDFNNIKYEINLYGQLSNIFSNLGDKKICQLNFSEYNHLYNVSAITNSWNTSIVKNNVDYVNWVTGYTTSFLDTEYTNGYVTLITFGNHQFKVGDTVWVEKADPTLNFVYNGTSTIIDIPDPAKITINKPWNNDSVLESGQVYVKYPTGEGYVYPYIEYGSDNLGKNNKTIPRLQPAVYVKTVVDKIFKEAGFKYQSDFFESQNFKRLINPFSGEWYQESDISIQRQEFRAGITGSSPFNSTLFFQQVVNANDFDRYLNFNCDTSTTTTPDCFDNNNNYYPNLPTNTPDLSGSFISQYHTTMKFETILDFDINTVLNIVTPPIPIFHQWVNPITQQWGAIKIRIVTYKRDISFINTPLEYTIVGSNELEYSYKDIQIPNNNSGHISPILSLNCVTEDVILKPTDEVFSEIEIIPLNPGPTSQLNFGASFYNLASQIKVNIKNTSRFYNQVTNAQINTNDIVDLSKLFSCDIKCSDYLLDLIKMFNLYVDDVKGKTNTLRIEPRNDYYKNNQVRDWTQKLDLLNSIEIVPLGEVLGKNVELTYLQDSDFWNEDYRKKTDEIYGNMEFTVDNDFIKNKLEIKTNIFAPSPQIEYPNSGISYPEIKKVEEQDGNITESRFLAKQRILYYGGLKTYKSYLDNSTNSIKFRYSGITQPYYPYVGMEDDGYISYYTINFGIPVISYYPRRSYSNGTLFNNYWRNYFLENTDKNAKIVTANFNLTPRDIFELDFRNYIYVDGQLYRLNKIIDYNPLTNSTTKVELLKVLDYTTFQTQVKEITNGDDNLYDTGEKNPFDFGSRPSLDDNITVIGYGNDISNGSNNVLVNGNINHIGQNSSQISIIGGSNNFILGGLNNVIIIGTDGVTVRNSNTTVINGVKYENGIAFPSMNIVDGVIDQAFIFGSSINANIFDAGLNNILDIGSPLNNNVIDGSIDTVYEI